MAVQKCPDCGANMIQITNRDYTTSYHCEYCGKNIHIQPESTADKLITFATRAVNSIRDRHDPVIRQQEYIEDLKRLRDESTGKRRARLDKQIANEERELEAYKRARRR